MRKSRMTPMLRYSAAVVLITAITTSLGARVADFSQSRMVVETKSAFQNGDTLAFHVTGRAPIKTPAPSRLAADLDVRSLASGESVGTP